MPNDVCKTIGHSLIQHGHFSNRVYLMKLDPRDLPGIVGILDDLATKEGYTKIFAKVPSNLADEFFSHGYRKEASIPGHYKGTKDALFLGRYFDPARAEAGDSGLMEEVLTLAKGKASDGQTNCRIPEGMKLISCGPDRADEMSRIYREVFPSYPFPIHNPAYLRETMESHVDYFGIAKDGELIALSSAEMDINGRNVEMTDFATLPAYRGYGLACCLLHAMEAAMIQREILTAYTIARAVSPSMNITFSRQGYRFGGRLINNTQISGSIESMNVWYKHLQKPLDK